MIDQRQGERSGARGPGSRPRARHRVGGGLTIVAAAAFVGAASASAQSDPQGVARPQVVEAARAQASLAARVRALRERYEARERSAPPAPDEALPDPPAAAGVPAPPDSPDGEMTQQREEEGRP